MATHCPLDSPQIYFYKCRVLAALTILKQLCKYCSKIIIQQLQDFSISMITKICTVFLCTMTIALFPRSLSFQKAFTYINEKTRKMLHIFSSVYKKFTNEITLCKRCNRLRIHLLSRAEGTPAPLTQRCRALPRKFRIKKRFFRIMEVDKGQNQCYNLSCRLPLAL